MYRTFKCVKHHGSKRGLYHNPEIGAATSVHHHTAYRAAEKLINQKYNSYAAQYPDQGNEIYLCMAALSIALSLKKNEFRNDTQPFVDSMKRMLDTLDETIGTKAQ